MDITILIEEVFSLVLYIREAPSIVMAVEILWRHLRVSNMQESLQHILQGKMTSSLLLHQRYPRVSSQNPNLKPPKDKP